MQIFLVGGAVRDDLLGLPITERDWVVVGATPERLNKLGFKPVGKDFPVFLHPDTQEEYALARTEKKTHPGYKGFSFCADISVSLEADLQRRDLTINAMAMTVDKKLIDPFGGQKDLKEKVLRHVSPAFVEDPVRLLRLARFAARYKSLGFTVAPETLELIQAMVAQGEVDALVPERVWKELDKALGEADPQVFFEILKGCGALKKLFPEIDALFGIPANPVHHPEIDTGVHTLMTLAQAARLTQDKVVRFAALVHDLGKARTPKEHWPKHINHERLGLAPINTLCSRTKAPRLYQELACITAQYHLLCHRVLSLKPSTLVDLLTKIDAFRRPDRFLQFLLASEADARGRLGFENNPYPQRAYFQNAFETARAISASNLQTEATGEALGRQLRLARIKALKKQ